MFNRRYIFIHGGFPIVVLVYQRVTYSPGNPFVALLSPWIFPFKLLDMLSNLLCNESFLVMGTNKSTLYQIRSPYIKTWISRSQLMHLNKSLLFIVQKSCAPVEVGSLSPYLYTFFFHPRCVFSQISDLSTCMKRWIVSASASARPFGIHQRPTFSKGLVQSQRRLRAAWSPHDFNRAVW